MKMHEQAGMRLLHADLQKLQVLNYYLIKLKIVILLSFNVSNTVTARS